MYIYIGDSFFVAEDRSVYELAKLIESNDISYSALPFGRTITFQVNNIYHWPFVIGEKYHLVLKFNDLGLYPDLYFEDNTFIHDMYKTSDNYLDITNSTWKKIFGRKPFELKDYPSVEIYESDDDYVFDEYRENIKYRAEELENEI
jgi:hypothetical protein